MIFPVQLHGRLQYQFRKLQVEQLAYVRYERIAERSRLLPILDARVNAILQANASAKSKLGQFSQLADALAAEIAPDAGCRRGCAACCHIAVSVSSLEAARLEHTLGLRAKKLSESHEPDDAKDLYFGTPCPFLEGSECSIYAHRPLSCRLHFTLDLDGYFCSTDIAPEDSRVPNVDLTAFWMGYAFLVLQAGGLMGDIRDFFPAGR